MSALPTCLRKGAAMFAGEAWRDQAKLRAGRPGAGTGFEGAACGCIEAEYGGQKEDNRGRSNLGVMTALLAGRTRRPLRAAFMKRIYPTTQTHD